LAVTYVNHCAEATVVIAAAPFLAKIQPQLFGKAPLFKGLSSD